jgi:hypothetical protein
VGADARHGDIALASLLRVHSLARNSGLMAAVEGVPPDVVEAGTSGYRFFGMDGAAEVVADLQEMLRHPGMSEDDMEAMELEADRLYGVVVPGDEVIVSRFETRLAADPEAFGPA